MRKLDRLVLCLSIDVFLKRILELTSTKIRTHMIGRFTLVTFFTPIHVTKYEMDLIKTKVIRI